MAEEMVFNQSTGWPRLCRRHSPTFPQSPAIAGKIDTRWKESCQTGLHINTKKIKVLKSNTKTRADMAVNSQISGRSRLLYLPWKRSRHLRGSDKDVKIRIGKARTAFNMMGSIWKARNISLKTKVWLFNSNVKTILLYGAETWKTTKGLLHKLQVFINKFLRWILNIRWPE